MPPCGGGIPGSCRASGNVCSTRFRTGPGLGLLVFFPPVLWGLSLPIFDFIAYLEQTKSHWALGLMVLPVFLPVMFSFVMTLGYVLLFLGYMLVASAMGENDHPRWPEWHPAEISEGIARWVWALLLGVALGGLPIALYWGSGREINWLHGVVLVNLLRGGDRVRPDGPGGGTAA